MSSIIEQAARRLEELKRGGIEVPRPGSPASDGNVVRVLARLEQAVTETASRALTASLEELGSATFRADLAGMRHEAQYTRLFRS